MGNQESGNIEATGASGEGEGEDSVTEAIRGEGDSEEDGDGAFESPPEDAKIFVGKFSYNVFKWIQLENPSIVVAFKWLLFGYLPFIASTLFTWATISADGMHNVAYYFMTFNYVFYCLFGISHASSFKAKQEVKYYGGEAPDDNFILSRKS